MLNRVILIGRTTADPEMQYTQSGIARTRFRLAVDRGFRSQQGERQTDFINIVCWRRQAEVVAEYLKKGRLVAVEGRLQSRSFKAPDGQNRVMYEVLADTVRFLENRATAEAAGSGGGRPAKAEPRGGGGAEAEEAYPEPEEEAPGEPEGDELPF